MSSTNGHAAATLPEGATLATLAMLQQYSRKTVKCPGLSERTGQDIFVVIRSIRRSAYLRMLPPMIPGADTWAKEDRDRLYREWEAALTDEQRHARIAIIENVNPRVLAEGLVEPAVTPEAAREFGDDVDVLAREILLFSKLIDEPTPEPATEGAEAE